MRKETNRRDLVAGIVSLFCYPPLSSAAEPEQPVELVVPYSPGGPTDAIAREVATELQLRTIRSIVRNTPGAGGAVAARYVGTQGSNRLLVGDVNTLTLRLLGAGESDRVWSGVVPLAALASSMLVLVVGASSGHVKIADLVASLKGRSEPLAVGVTGIGSSTHLGVEAFALKCGFRVQAIPYSGATMAISALIGGHVEAGLFSVGTLLPAITSGRLRPLAVTGTERLADLPSVPTFLEAGYEIEVLQFGSWWALFGWSTNLFLSDRFRENLSSACSSEDLKRRLKSLHVMPLTLDIPIDEWLLREEKRWRRILLEIGMLRRT